jgi:hypothetical protein
MMLLGMDVDPDRAKQIPLRYLTRNRLNLEDPSRRAMIEQEIKDHRPALVVMDSMIRFARFKSENDNAEIAAFFDRAIMPMIAKYGCSFVILDHMRKPGGGTKERESNDPAHRIRGGGDKAGVADEIWTLEGDRQTAVRTLSHRKTRWDELQPDILTEWHKSDDGTRAWISAKEKLEEANGIITRFLASRGELGARTGEIVEYLGSLGIAKRSTERSLGWLVGKDLIFQPKKGEYALKGAS